MARLEHRDRAIFFSRSDLVRSHKVIYGVAIDVDAERDVVDAEGMAVLFITQRGHRIYHAGSPRRQIRRHESHSAQE